MELIDEIKKKLSSVNAVQFQGAQSVATYVWDKDAWMWVEVHEGPSQRHLNQHKLIEKLLDTPHTTRRTGTMLVVTPIDLTKKV
jgi:hypothetical protein